MDERIEKATRLLLVDLRLISEQMLQAKVYVLTTSDGHEWVPIEESFSVADTAKLIGRLSRLDRGVQFQVWRSDWDRKYKGGQGRDALLRDLASALHETGVSVSMVEPQP